MRKLAKGVGPSDRVREESNAEEERKKLSSLAVTNADAERLTDWQAMELAFQSEPDWLHLASATHAREAGYEC